LFANDREGLLDHLPRVLIRAGFDRQVDHPLLLGFQLNYRDLLSRA
jgi:hypothetical protein